MHGYGSHALITRSSDTLHVTIDADETVMLCTRSGKYYSLNGVASRVWQTLESPKTLAQICVRICDEFAVEAAACERDMLTYIEALQGNGLVHITWR